MVLSGIKYNFRPRGVKSCGSFVIFGTARRMYPNTQCGCLRWGTIVKVSHGKSGWGSWGNKDKKKVKTEEPETAIVTFFSPSLRNVHSVFHPLRIVFYEHTFFFRVENIVNIYSAIGRRYLLVENILTQRLFANTYYSFALKSLLLYGVLYLVHKTNNIKKKKKKPS